MNTLHTSRRSPLDCERLSLWHTNTVLLWRQNPLISGCVTQADIFCLFMTQRDSEVSYKREPSLYKINIFNSQGLPSKIWNKYDYMLLEVKFRKRRGCSSSVVKWLIFLYTLSETFEVVSMLIFCSIYKPIPAVLCHALSFPDSNLSHITVCILIK